MFLTLLMSRRKVQYCLPSHRTFNFSVSKTVKITQCRIPLMQSAVTSDATKQTQLLLRCYGVCDQVTAYRHFSGSCRLHHQEFNDILNSSAACRSFKTSEFCPTFTFTRNVSPFQRIVLTPLSTLLTVQHDSLILYFSFRSS